MEVLSSIYINKTYIYSKKNIAGFELLDRENLSYMYNDFNYYGRYKIREILIDFQVLFAFN